MYVHASQYRTSASSVTLHMHIGNDHQCLLITTDEIDSGDFLRFFARSPSQCSRDFFPFSILRLPSAFSALSDPPSHSGAALVPLTEILLRIGK